MNFRRVVVTALVLSAAVFSLAGCGKSSSVTSPASLDNSPPTAPSNLIGLYDTTQQRDYLAWTPSASPAVSSYEVWQYDGNPAAGNSGTLVGTTSSATTYYALPAPTQNTIQYYRMRSVTGGHGVSAYSGSLSLQRHGAQSQGVGDPGEGNGNPQIRAFK